MQAQRNRSIWLSRQTARCRQASCTNACRRDSDVTHTVIITKNADDKGGATAIAEHVPGGSYGSAAILCDCQPISKHQQWLSTTGLTAKRASHGRQQSADRIYTAAVKAVWKPPAQNLEAQLLPYERRPQVYLKSSIHADRFAQPGMQQLPVTLSKSWSSVLHEETRCVALSRAVEAGFGTGGCNFFPVAASLTAAGNVENLSNTRHQFSRSQVSPPWAAWPPPAAA